MKWQFHINGVLTSDEGARGEENINVLRSAQEAIAFLELNAVSAIICDGLNGEFLQVYQYLREVLRRPTLFILLSGDKDHLKSGQKLKAERGDNDLEVIDKMPGWDTALIAALARHGV